MQDSRPATFCRTSKPMSSYLPIRVTASPPATPNCGRPSSPWSTSFSAHGRQSCSISAKQATTGRSTAAACLNRGSAHHLQLCRTHRPSRPPTVRLHRPTIQRHNRTVPGQQAGKHRLKQKKPSLLLPNPNRISTFAADYSATGPIKRS